MSGLPKGWVKCAIDDVTLKPDQRKPEAAESFHYIDIGSIDRLRKQINQPTIITGLDAPSRARKVVNQDDILVSMTRPNLNAVAKVTPNLDQQIASTGFDVLKPVMIEPDWLFSIVKSKSFVNSISGESIGALYPACKSNDIRNFSMPLPPLPEQKRIVEKLDVVLAQVDSIKARLDAIPDLLKRFRQSVLASAVSGKLTEEWRQHHSCDTKIELINLLEKRQQKFEKIGKKDKELKREANATELEELPSNWLYSTLDPFLDIERSGMKTGPFGSLLKKHEHQDSGVPVLGIENISAGTFIKGSKIHISEKKAEELVSYDVLAGDLLISRSGTVGDICSVPENLGKMRFSTNLMRVSFLEGAINTAYFCYLFLGSKSVLRQVSQLCKGSTRDFLNQKILGSIHYPIPPLLEQKEIVRLVDQYFTFADTIEAQVKKAQARVDNLTQSILAKAFRGELVPQDDNDEPADKLLERIAQARAQAEALAKAAKKAESAKKRAPKAATNK